MDYELQKSDILANIANEEYELERFKKLMELNGKKKANQTKLDCIFKFKLQANYTNKIDSIINKYESMLERQPERVNKVRDELKNDISLLEQHIEYAEAELERQTAAIEKSYESKLAELERQKEALERSCESKIEKLKSTHTSKNTVISNKLKAKQSLLDDTTYDTDKYTIFLRGELDDSIKKRESILDQHKSKEETTLLHHQEEIQKDIDKLNNERPSNRNEISKPSVLDRINKERYTVRQAIHPNKSYKPPSKPIEEPTSSPANTVISRRSFCDDPDDMPLPIELTKSYSSDYLLLHRREGLNVMPTKQEMERIDIQQQKDVWNLLNEDQVDALKESGYTPHYSDYIAEDSDEDSDEEDS